jgi:hypothetical protein
MRPAARSVRPEIGQRKGDRLEWRQPDLGVVMQGGN